MAPDTRSGRTLTMRIRFRPAPARTRMPTSTPSGFPSRRGPRFVLRRVAAAGIAFACLSAATACELAGASSSPPAPQKGGTLFINVQGGLDSLDPQGTYEAVEWNILRLMVRGLTALNSAHDAMGDIVPDLATDTGRPSENNTIWEFTLKPNVRWEGGEPVTCSQVKYGIERVYATTIISGGTTYPQEYLRDNESPYKGPYVGGNNNGKGLESIECVDERNIRFTLARPVGDFGYVVSLPTFAPVLPEKDTKADYAKRSYSNGPYKVESRDAEHLVLVRNNFWVATNDQVRKAYPDRMVFDFRQDESGVLTNEIIENQGDARNTLMLDANVSPNFLQQVINDPELIGRALTGPTGAVRYFAINTRRIPNIACRQALIYAFNKRKWRAVNGGSVTGDYATTMITPGMRGYKNFDVFQTATNPEGDPDKALAMTEAQKQGSKPCPPKIRIAFPDVALRKRQLNTVVEAYQIAGIQVQPVPLDPAAYFSTVGDATNDFDLILAGWIPDWPSASSVLPPLFDGDLIPDINPVTGKALGNVNFPLLDDPNINEQLDAARAETAPDRQATLWGELDQQIQERAVTIPLLYDKAIRLMGSNVGGGFVHTGLGMPDLASLGLLQP
jgi:peptide/nickel transport system substrate-binding protein